MLYHILIESNILAKEDRMEEKIIWHQLTPILLDEELTNRTCQSTERDIQYAREKTCPPLVYHLFL